MSRFLFMPRSRVLKSSLTLISAVSLAACSDSSPPNDLSHLGTFSSSRPDVPYIKIYQSNDKDYVISPWGGLELVVDENGKVSSADESVGLVGEFSNIQDGLYEQLDYTIYGESVSLKRVDELEGAELVSKMYQDIEGFENISSGNTQCESASLQTNLNDSSFDSDLIGRLVEKAQSDFHPLNKTTSIVVAHDGEIVIEEYMNGWSADYPHTIQSITKSLTSLAAGALVQEGKIEGEDQKVASLLPDYADALTDKKSELTLKHFLTMSAGLEWDEWSTSYDNDNNSRNREMNSPDAVEYVLSQKLVKEPGEQFVYNGGLVTAVGKIIEEHSGKEDAGQYLVSGPLSNLCFKNAYMHIQNRNTYNFAGGGYLRSRDLLKLGLLVKNDGSWNGEQLIDKQWVAHSLEEEMTTNWNGMRYGYFWWMQDYIIEGETFNVVYGLGYGGQVLAIVEELDLVAVRTATNFRGSNAFDGFMKDYVIPAFVRGQPKT